MAPEWFRTLDPPPVRERGTFYGKYVTCVLERAGLEVVPSYFCYLWSKKWQIDAEKEEQVERYTVADAATVLGVTTNRVRQLIREGQLVSEIDPRLGYQVIEKALLDDFMRKREQLVADLEQQRLDKQRALAARHAAAVAEQAARAERRLKEEAALSDYEREGREPVTITRKQLADLEWARDSYHRYTRQDRIGGLCVHCTVCGTVEPLSLWRSLLFTKKQAEYPPVCGHGWGAYELYTVHTQADEEPLWNHEAHPISKSDK